MEYIRKISYKIILCSILFMTTTILFSDSYPRNMKQYTLQRVLITDTEKEHNVDLMQYIKNKKNFVFISFFKNHWFGFTIILLIILGLLIYWLCQSIYYEETVHIILCTLLIITIVILPWLPKTLQNYFFDFTLIQTAKRNLNSNITLIEDILLETSNPRRIYKLAENNPRINIDKIGKKIASEGSHKLIYKTIKNINGVNIEQLTTKLINKPKWIYKLLKNTYVINVNSLCLKLSKDSGWYTTRAIKDGLCNGIY